MLFRNPTQSTITVADIPDIDGLRPPSDIAFEPGAIREIPNRYAYVVEHRGLPLLPESHPDFEVKAEAPPAVDPIAPEGADAPKRSRAPKAD
jgi:hypothetical protein